jgi:hypothetical protein
MPIETDADRRMFVREDDFAVSVQWTSNAGTAVFSAIFDDNYALAIVPELDAGVEGSTPQILAVSSDVPADAEQGDSLIVRYGLPTAKTYIVVEFKPDGTGMTIARLQEA